MSDFNLNDLPQDTNLASKVIDGKIKNQQTIMERGFIGRIFGGSENISYNVTALSVVLCILCILFLIIKGSGTDSFSYKDSTSIVSNIITLFVGYLFGKTTNKEN